MSLQPLFLPLLDVLLKGAVILVAGAACLALARKASAANRHAIFLAVFGALLLLPLTKLVDPRWSLAVAQDAVPTTRVELAEANLTPSHPQPGSSPTASAARRASTPFALPWNAIVVAVWLGGAMLLLARRIYVGFRLRSLARSSALLQDSRLVALTQELSAAQGIRVTARESSNCPVPLVAGVLRPIVILPKEARQWSEREVVSALCHEFGHIRRRDCLARLIADLTVALYWLNPLVWVMSRQMRVAQEQACDDLVLSSGAPPDAYASQLVNVVRGLQENDFTSRHALAMAQPSTLETRVVAILDPTRERSSRSGRGTVAGVACILGLLGVCAAAQLEGAQTSTITSAGKTDPNTATGNKEHVVIAARFIETSGDATDLPALLRGPGPVLATAADVDAMIKNLEKTKRVQIVAAPRVITPSGQRAKIAIAQPFTYSSDWEKDPATGRWKSKAVATENLGLTFEVTPIVKADSSIELDLAPETIELTDMRDLDSPATDGKIDPARVIPEGHRSQPVFAHRKVRTQATVMPGNTIAIGGLDTSKKNMVVLVTAEPVGPDKAAAADEEKKPRVPENPKAPAPKEKRDDAQPKVLDKKPAAQRERAALDISADRFEASLPVPKATGNVSVVYRDAKMRADEASYDKESGTVTLVGNVRFEHPAKEITAEKLTYNIDSGAISTEGPTKTTLKNVSVPKR